MKRMTLSLSLSIALLPVGWAAAGPSGGDYELVRTTFDGGGITFATGGDYELSGTAGQPDAGPLAGGDYTLAGGFWFEEPPGDCDADGAVDLDDFASFPDCLLGPGGGMGPDCECFDLDQSGDVDLLDFAEFQAVFTVP